MIVVRLFGRGRISFTEQNASPYAFRDLLVVVVLLTTRHHYYSSHTGSSAVIPTTSFFNFIFSGTAFYTKWRLAFPLYAQNVQTNVHIHISKLDREKPAVLKHASFPFLLCCCCCCCCWKLHKREKVKPEEDRQWKRESETEPSVFMGTIEIWHLPAAQSLPFFSSSSLLYNPPLHKGQRKFYKKTFLSLNFFPTTARRTTRADPITDSQHHWVLFPWRMYAIPFSVSITPTLPKQFMSYVWDTCRWILLLNQ